MIHLKSNDYHTFRHDMIPKKYFDSIKFSSKRRKIKFDLNIESLSNLFIHQQGKCALTGKNIEFSKKNQTASLDRINSNIGYELNNVQWVHKDINRSKMSLSNKEYIYWLKIFMEHQGYTIL